MAHLYGWQPGFLWAAVETQPPFRLIGLYPSQSAAIARAYEFGSPAAVQPVPDAGAAAALCGQVRSWREGR